MNKKISVHLLRESSRVSKKELMTNKFIYTAKEYANKCRISASALRKRRLAGKLEGLYEVREGFYFYADGGSNKGSFTGKNLPRSVSKRRNVPRHQTRYASGSLQRSNDLKQLMRIQNWLKETEIEHITPDIIEVAKQRHKEELFKKLKEPFLPNTDAIMQQQQKMVDKRLIEIDEKYEAENKNMSSPFEPKNNIDKRDIYY